VEKEEKRQNKEEKEEEKRRRREDREEEVWRRKWERRGRGGVVPEIIEPIFTKTSPKRSFCITENDRFGLVFTKTASINSGMEKEVREM
jgi:hypothetical protein